MGPPSDLVASMPSWTLQCWSSSNFFFGFMDERKRISVAVDVTVKAPTVLPTHIRPARRSTCNSTCLHPHSP